MSAFMLKNETQLHLMNGYKRFFVKQGGYPRFKSKHSNETVGVDLGLSCYAALSTGEKIPNPRPYRKAEQNLKRLSRALSRKKKGLANRTKARAKLA